MLTAFCKTATSITSYQVCGWCLLMRSGSLNLKYLRSAEKSQKAGKCELQAGEMNHDLRDSLHLGFLMVETETRITD